MTVLSQNPKNVHDGYKEAVVDSLLNNLSARLAGRSEFYRYVLGAKPSGVLMSEFLVPMPAEERRGDEEADPIRISAHGLDFQVRETGALQTYKVSLRGGFYVRVLPREDEVRPGGVLEAVFPLTRVARNAIRTDINDALKALASSLDDGRRNAAWAERSEVVRRQVYERLGLPFDNHLDRTPTDEEGRLLDLAQEDEPTTAVEGMDKPISIEDEEAEPRAATEVRASGAVPDAMADAISPPQKWLRLDFALPDFEFTLTSAGHDAAEASKELNTLIEAKLLEWANSKDEPDGGQLWGFRRARPIRPSDIGNWQRYLDSIRSSELRVVLPKIELRWVVNVTPDPVDPSVSAVHVAIENWSDPLTKTNHRELEPGFFQCSLSVSVPSAVHHFLRLDRVKPSYRYNEYLRYPALGFNAGVNLTRDDQVNRLTTTWSPRYVLPRVIPSDAKVERRISELAKPDCLSGLAPLVEVYEAWLKNVRYHPIDKGLDGPNAAAERVQEEGKLRMDLKAWEGELTAIRNGLTILEHSRKHWTAPGPQKSALALPFEAWVSMNDAMARVAQTKGYEEWRLFQVAFILASIPAFATRIPEFHSFYTPEVAEHANAVTLLYFSTGGGKSEAFLGLLMYVLFLDRLRGKHQGVSALMRYPLRLLTLQQSRRTFAAMGAAEHVRHERKHPGEPFSLGFWVGGSNTPNWHSDEGYADVPFDKDVPLKAEAAHIKSSTAYKAAKERWQKLTTCPFCNMKNIVLRRRARSKDHTLGHYCATESARCSWNKRHDTPEPLPFYIVDEDIYDLAPSVLLGTVDKLAALGQSQGTIRKFLGMFGFAPLLEQGTQRLYVPMWSKDWDGHPGGQTAKLYPAYPDGDKRFFDPFPSLLIQDEAHLLDESLGSFSGLFESALEAAFDRLKELMPTLVACEPNSTERRRIKVIAASATVTEPQRQMRNLYQREHTVQFPYPGPDLYSSFYAAPQQPDGSAEDSERWAVPVEDVETRSHWARVYASILTNGHRHTVAMASVLGHYHLIVTGLYERLRGGDPAQQKCAREELLRWVSQGPLYAQFFRLLSTADSATLLTLVDLHRISLTYVTNKKGGDQVIDTEATQFEKLHKANGFPDQRLASELISGAVSAADIQEVVRRAEARVEPGKPFPDLNDTLRSVIATSAISHGVDVEEFNAMFFAGMPSDIAEYIQASSRVGRTHVGFSLLVPVPQRYRDRFVLEIHDIFHRFLERMILPAAVDRWAEKALVRVMPSFFQEFVCGVRAIELLCAAPEAAKSRSPIFAMASDVRDFMNVPANFKAVEQFMQRALGLHVNPPPQGKAYYQALLREQLTRYQDDMSVARLVTGTRLNQFFALRDALLRPMTSLRDVDQPGVIHESRVDASSKLVKDGLTARAMTFIRRGSGADIDAGDGETEASRH
jgi:hypothetical protein